MALNGLGLGFVFQARDESAQVMGEVEGNLQKTKRAAEAASLSMKDIGKGLQTASVAATVGGGAIAAGLGFAVSEAAKFQFGIAQVATEADAAKFPAMEIARVAKEMATTYGGNLDQQIKAAYQGVAAGADTAAKSTALLAAANKLAIAGNASQEQSLLGISKVLNNYAMSFDRASEVSDAFFVAVRSGQTTVGELGDAIGQVAALGRNAGVSMEELIGALGTAATLGKDTASSAAAMKAALSGVAHPTASAAKEAQRLGISFDAASLRSMGLVKFLGQITGSAKYSADSMNLLFGSVEGAAFMSALAADNMSALRNMMGGMAQKAGGAESAFQTMSATLTQASSVLSANFQVALVDLGTTFLPLVTTVVRFVSSVLKGFNALPGPVKSGVAVFLALTAAALLVSGAVTGIAAALMMAEVPLAALTIGFGTLVAIMAPLVVIGGAVALVAYAIKRAFDENVGGLRDTVVPIFDKVRLAWSALSQAFSQGGFSGAVRDELAKAENQGVKNFAVNLYTWFGRIKNFFDGVSTGFAQASAAAGPTFAKLAIAFDKLASAFGRLFGGKQNPDDAARTFDKFGESGKSLGAAIAWVADIMVSGLTFAIEYATSFIDIISNWRGVFSDAGSQIYQVWNALGSLVSALGMVFAALSGSSGQTQSATSYLAAFVVVIASTIAMGARLTAAVVGTWAAAFRILSGVISEIGHVTRAVFGFVVNDMLHMGETAKGIIGGIRSLLGMKGGDTAGPAGGAPGAKSPLLPAGGSPSVVGAPLLFPTASPMVTSTPAVQDARGAASAQARGGAPPTADAIGSSVASAMRAAAPPAPAPVNVFLDGEKIADALAGRSGAAAGRAYVPSGLPTG